MKNLVFVVYDSICNSVFHGQVIAPLIKKLKRGDFGRVYIVSFELHKPDKKIVDAIVDQHSALSLIILKKNSFITPLFLFLEIKRLKKYLKFLEQASPEQAPPEPALFDNYELIARGALAGYIAQRALDSEKCQSVTIQARGLLAEEYAYTHQNGSFLKKHFYRWRETQYSKIEQSVYEKKRNNIYTIEVVSRALQEYLVETFGADSASCTLASDDVPAKIDESYIVQWRDEIRKKLKIPSYFTVYCFSGAAKPWQCPHLVVDFFKKQYAQNKNVFLLVLTQDVSFFQQALSKFPNDNYHLSFVKHEDVYKHLASADIGLVFREPGIVSWIARPVKAMEYEAAGLNIIHNSTVDWLVERHNICNELHF